MRMEPILAILAALFAAFFILNVYFRVNVFRHYRKLIDHRIDFSARDIFSESRMHAVIDKYPAHRTPIMKFCRNMRRSVWMASVFLVLVITLGMFLLKNR